MAQPKRVEMAAGDVACYDFSTLNHASSVDVSAVEASSDTALAPSVAALAPSVAAFAPSVAAFAPSVAALAPAVAVPAA